MNRVIQLFFLILLPFYPLWAWLSIYFLKKPVGFVPSIIGNILKERVKLKNQMKDAVNPREKQVLDVQQQALKRLANSMYGVYGYSRFRWYRIECAEAVTAWGRDFIKKTMLKAEEYGFKAIYADTDGFYATFLPENEDISE